MKIIYLPGFSARNKEAAAELKSEFKKEGFELNVIHWDHWQSGKSSFNFGNERGKVLKACGQDECVIIAKSVGTRLIASMIARDENLHIKYLVLMGVPSQNRIYTDMLAKYPVKKLLVIQNDKDPYQSYAELKRFFHGENVDIEIIRGDRSDHSYPFADIITDKIKKL